MSEETELREYLEEDGGTITSESFTFATPSFVSSPDKVINFGVNSEHVFSARQNQENSFIFAPPASASQLSSQIEDSGEETVQELKAVRKLYNAPSGLFTSALQPFKATDKLIEDYCHLKKHAKSRSAVKEDTRKSITCTNVPEQLLTKTAAKEYFTQFGQTAKITLKPRKTTITVHYTNRAAANAAFHKAGQFAGKMFDVSWTSSEVAPKSSTKRTVKSDEEAVRNLITADKYTVNAELQAMMGLEYNMHGVKTPQVLLPPKPKLKKSREVTKHEKLPSKAALKSERPEHEPQAIVPKASAEELQNIIRQAAYTAEEKYKVLEARDRLIRLKQIKPNSLAAAKITIGTCPDMCPEKERLMREAQRQVALYEQLESREYRINHTKAVKQYSRSSADQEEPLAHELRPVASLKMTMSYLLHEIMDMCMAESTNLAEWFHFLWDRTRGIRKDITQQELCCVDSVELVEQCARFHIFCSERLCAEGPSVFDKKINTENLTKCLQTLKYMYHDLRVKGVTCENEAEFRGYIVLLNLDNANFMWDLQKLPPDIQKSPEVRFTIEVYSSIDSHNFSKFFKLVKKTTYLNACILLRYFQQVRVKALSVMVKAYCRVTFNPFPLYELIDILGFEDENEAVNFCKQVGLNISTDEMDIVLTKENFSEPESSIEQGRAILTVESKRTRHRLSVGQCIAGGRMPEKIYKNHIPHDSFDSKGYLQPSAINVEDQTKQYKCKTGPVKNDPYEFMEEDTIKSSQKLRPQLKSEDQTDTGTRKPNQTLLAESSSKSAGFGDVLNKSDKIPPLFPTVFDQAPVQKVQFSFTKPSTAFQKSETNTPFVFRADTSLPLENKASISDVKPCQNLGDGDKFKSHNFGAFSKLSQGTAQIGNQKPISENNTGLQHGLETSKTKDISPFCMPQKKSTFSEITPKNIFGKPDSGVQIVGTKTVKTDATREFEKKERERIEVELNKKKLEEIQRQLEAEKQKLKELERAKRLKEVEKEAKQILDEVEDEMMKEICESVLKEAIDLQKMYDVLSKNETESLVDQIVLQLCTELLKEEIRIQDGLNRISKRIEHRIMKKYYKTWRQNVTKKRRQREALDDTPVWLQNHSVSECARLLYHPEQDMVLDNMRRKRLRTDSPPQEDNLAPVEVIIYAGIKENLKSSDNELIPNVFWKLVISWPDVEHQVQLWQYKKIMNTYLNPENYTQEPIMKTYSPNEYETLNICIRHFEGIINDYNLVGTDGLLFLAASSENLNTVKRRLSKTILSRSKLMPIPIAIVFLGPDDLVPENVELELDLEILLESGYVSEYTVVFEKEINKSQILRLIQSAALWLTTNKSPVVPLEMDYLNQVLSACLTQELWLRIQGHSNFNKHLASALDDPAFIINLHNEAVTHLTDIFLDPESLQYTEFPREFKSLLSDQVDLPYSYEYFDNAWKNEQNRSELEQIMNSFRLPDWKYQWPIANMSELHNAIKNYCSKALPDYNCDDLAYKVMNALFFMTDNSQSLSFIEVILEIAKRKILLLETDLRVVYNKNHVKHFRTLPWWFKSSILLEYISQKELDIQNQASEKTFTNEPFEKRQRLQPDFNDDLDVDSFYDRNDSLAEYCKESQDRVMTVHGMCKQFELDMEKQKMKNKALNKLLEQALLDEDLNILN
ncbi:uncharacterized protein LOC124309310 [Neodiprion virginianus]|uniref:uncharacterized protein LOC124309310 n=1 Tax=Neodiprion virginianus TaxID=2961670 RepID=UPI001EE696CC|nr:uncharacterized protein LOC124309310 [Neodiprion virginianus]